MAWEGVTNEHQVSICSDIPILCIHCINLFCLLQDPNEPPHLWLFTIGPACLAHVVAQSCLLPSYPLFVLCMHIFSKHLLARMISLNYSEFNSSYQHKQPLLKYAKLLYINCSFCIYIHINCSTLALHKSLTVYVWIIFEKLFADKALLTKSITIIVMYVSIHLAFSFNHLPLLAAE